MKTEDLKKFGNLSKARRIVAMLDSLWDILLDATAFSDAPEKEVEAIEVPLASARQAAANLLARYGDASGYMITPRPKRQSIKESHTEPE